MKAVILLADGFEDIQFFCTFFRLREEGLQVTIAATGDCRQLAGLHGYTVEPDMPIPELNPSEYDLLVIPGGRSPEKLRLNEEAVNLARTFIQDNNFVATIGHGPQLLISAGAIDGKALTCAPEIRDDVRCAAAAYRDEAVYVDGNLISARGNEDIHLFCEQIVAALTIRSR